MKIVNIICSGNLKQNINLNALMQIKGEIFEYDPEIYHGGYILLPFCKITIYHSGKYIIVGLKSLDMVEPAFLQLKTILSPYINLSLAQNPIIQNIVAIENIGKKISLHDLYLSLKAEDNAKYDPKKFPAIIYKFNGLTAFLFSSGKILLMGAKSEQSVKKGMDAIIKIIDKLLF